jgi:predicted MPP superfamily phosphohydrolase
MPTVKSSVRIAGIADLHYGRTATPGSLQPLLSQINESADILVVCGDLTDFGLTEEARALAREFAVLKIPIVGVLGNHDFESSQQEDRDRFSPMPGLCCSTATAPRFKASGSPA